MRRCLATITALAMSATAAAQVSGSGFFITSSGVAVTNYHVIEDAAAVEVVDASGAKYDATILRVDIANDLALLQVSKVGAAFVRLGFSSSIRRGDKVFALGFPLTTIQGVEPKLTDGIVSSLSGIRDEPRTFQITNAIQPGNSGGPLFADDGQVIGVVVASLNASRVLEATGVLPQNVNYAVKSNYILELVASVGSIRLPVAVPQRQNRRVTDVVADAERALIRILVTTTKLPKARAPSPIPPAAPHVPRPSTLNPEVRLATSLGDIVIELEAAKAPKTVDNFLQYVKAGHYDGTIFHRVIENFMIQGGGMKADMSEKSTRAPIPLESRSGLSNIRGAISMARTMDPNSATAQFFINVKDNPNLDQPNSRDGNGYAVFGKVVAGMEVVDKIKAVTVADKGGHQNVPTTPVLIKKASVEKDK